MAITIHTITSYAVQLLTKKAGEGAQSYITLRLYDHDSNNRGIVAGAMRLLDVPPDSVEAGRMVFDTRGKDLQRPEAAVSRQAIRAADGEST